MHGAQTLGRNELELKRIGMSLIRCRERFGRLGTHPGTGRRRPLLCRRLRRRGSGHMGSDRLESEHVKLLIFLHSPNRKKNDIELTFEYTVRSEQAARHVSVLHLIFILTVKYLCKQWS